MVLASREAARRAAEGTEIWLSRPEELRDSFQVEQDKNDKFIIHGLQRDCAGREPTGHTQMGQTVLHVFFLLVIGWWWDADARRTDGGF